ncbi:MAG: hypothetical protein ACI4EN_00045 [Butyrivibrio sp.]
MRFRIIFLILPLILTALFFLLYNLNFKGSEKTVPVPTETPTIRDDGEYTGFYISVPGMVRAEISRSHPEIPVYNPGENTCALIYEVYNSGERIGGSGLVMPGTEGLIGIERIPGPGEYRVRIVTTGYSVDGKIMYNSVSQNVDLIVI